MVRYASLLCALILAAYPAESIPLVKRVIGGGDLVPGNAEIQDAGPESPIRQTVTTNGMTVSGLEVYAARYPKDKPVDLTVSCVHGGRILRNVRTGIPPDHLLPLRITFQQIHGYDKLDFVIYPDHKSHGRGARILFFPRDHYPGGNLHVGGRRIGGDLLFQVLTPNPSTTTFVPGLDMFGQRGRFPSPILPPGNQLIQEFAAPRDSLSFIEFIAGTGGRTPGPNLKWSVEKPAAVAGRGMVPVRYDNETIRVTFPTIDESRGAPLKLVLEIADPWNGDLRFWLCARSPGMGALSVADRRVDASLVFRTFHTTATRDSMSVCISAIRPPEPMPSGPVAGSCNLVQEFTWEGSDSPRDFIGLRLAVGGGLTSGTVSYAIETADSDTVISSGTIRLAGYGSDDYIWFPVGYPRGNRPLRLTLSAPGIRSENAARFWWSPFDIVPDARAYGCVPSPGGDCVFKLAMGYSPGEWLRIAPSLSRSSPAMHRRDTGKWLVAIRGIILIGMILFVLIYRPGVMSHSGVRRKNE